MGHILDSLYLIEIKLFVLALTITLLGLFTLAKFIALLSEYNARHSYTCLGFLGNAVELPKEPRRAQT
jgi:hypothetical protein